MIFADKLMHLRKKAGWSQEELAEQMNVTRQSVSKWEGAQSIPDLEKMVRLSELFGVSTDYLLKDEFEEPEALNASKELSSIRQVSMEEANAFLSIKAAASKPIAYAVFLCILSPICLFLLGAAADEAAKYGVTDNAAAGIGMVILLIFVAIAVAIFIANGSKTAPYEYLEKEIFETAYGVSGMVKERKEQYKNTYTKNNIIGACLCILSLIPLFGGMAFSEDDTLLVLMLSVCLVIAGIGVIFFVRTGIIWESYEKLLQEGDYSKEKKEKQPIVTAVSTAYWLTAAAVFLSYSLTTSRWEYSWIILVAAGVLFPAIIALIHAFGRKK